MVQTTTGSSNGGNGEPAAVETAPPAAPAKVDIDALLEADAAEPTLPAHASDYRQAETPLLGARELWDDPRIGPAVADRLLDVVAFEGPIHIDEATRRVAASWSGLRATKRSVEKVRVAAMRIAKPSRPVTRGDFLWPPDIDPTTWRAFRLHPDNDTRRAAEHLPPQEVANAAEWLVSQSGSIARDELVMEISRLFGYRSTGKKVRAAMETGIEYLVTQGRVEVVGDAIRPAVRSPTS